MISSADFWQYAGVFFALVGAAFGAPIPEEIPIATGGVLVSQAYYHPNETALCWQVMLPLCIFGVVLCDVILYGVGRKWGHWLIGRRWVQRRVLTPARFEKIKKNFHDYGIRILLITRFVPGVRTPVFLTAGIVRLPFRKFLLADAIYAIPGVNLIFWGAYFLTDSFILLLREIEGYRNLAVVAILSFVAGFIAATFVRRPVSTGSPDDLPMFGKPVVNLRNHPVQDGPPGTPGVMDGRPHGPSANGQPGAGKTAERLAEGDEGLTPVSM